MTIKRVFSDPKTIQETKGKAAQVMCILTQEGLLSLNLGHG